MPTDPVTAVQNWGRQTIIFALGLRTDPEWTSLPEDQQAARVQKEFEPICQSLWEAAQKECGDNLNMMPKVFSKHVLRWAQENTNLD